MRTISSGSSAEKVLGFTVYVSSRLEADPEATDLAAIIDESDKGFRRKLGQRNAAADAVTRKRALRDHHLRASAAAIKALAFEAEHHFGAKGKKAFSALFPEAPSRLVLTPEKSREEAFGGLLTRAQELAHVAQLKPLVKAFGEAWTRLQATQSALNASLDGETRAIKALLGAKDAIGVAARKVYGQLLARFPEDAERCDSYFPASAAKTKPKGKKPPPAAPPGASTTAVAGLA